MFAIRFMSVAFFLVGSVDILPASERSEWSKVLDSVALMLLAVVLWFAVEPGAEELRPPKVGTRTLRLVLYSAILMLFVVAGSGRQFVGDSWGCGNVTTALFAAVVLTPFIRSELDARKREAVS
jgi:hypothetical protein